MKVLFLCHSVQPQYAPILEVEAVPIEGWITGFLNNLRPIEGLQLVVLAPAPAYKTGVVEGVTVYGTTAKQRKEEMTQILTQENPDVIHIFGAENQQALDMVEVATELNVLHRVALFIQGLRSFYAHHYGNGLPYEVISRPTEREIKENSSIPQQIEGFKKAGEKELQVISMVKHVIGRTDWDRACCIQTNPEVQYHFCNETLRNSFYQHQWNLTQCENHSIFISQYFRPVKAFHYMLEALPEILKRFPDTKVYTTQTPPSPTRTYSNYLLSLMKKYQLEDKIFFLGVLNEEEMCQRFLQSHVVALPSTVENSPNSLGEAMILGVPTVSAFVGGVGSMISHNEEGFLYHGDAPYLLAHYICEIFENPDLAKKFSVNGQKRARITHNSQTNMKKIQEIYQEIASQ